MFLINVLVCLNIHIIVILQIFISIHFISHSYIIFLWFFEFHFLNLYLIIIVIRHPVVYDLAGQADVFGAFGDYVFFFGVEGGLLLFKH